MHQAQYCLLFQSTTTWTFTTIFFFHLKIVFTSWSTKNIFLIHIIKSSNDKDKYYFFYLRIKARVENKQINLLEARDSQKILYLNSASVPYFLIQFSCNQIYLVNGKTRTRRDQIVIHQDKEFWPSYNAPMAYNRKAAHSHIKLRTIYSNPKLKSLLKISSIL